MGGVKNYYHDVINAEIQELNLAVLLGLSLEDIQQLNWVIEEDASEDGLVYNYRVEFSEGSSAEVLAKIDLLEDGRRVNLQPWELDAEYDYEEHFRSITENKGFVQKYNNEIENLLEILSIQSGSQKLQKILHRQIFIGVISSMETFLADVFINLTFDNKEYFRKFVETHPEFKRQKFELREIYEKHNNLEDIARIVMLDMIYHNLPKVSEMYRSTFDIRFPKITEVYKFVLMRHDLVHRNGVTKSGEEIMTDADTIEGMIEEINSFVNEIAKLLNL